MGASNVALVYANWSHLGHREARALAFMALISLDADEPPVYWGGWQSLASAVGADLEGNPVSAKKTAMQILRKLREAGAIVSSSQARQGTRSEYALALRPEVTYRPIGSGRSVDWEEIPRDILEVDSLRKIPSVMDSRVTKSVTQPVTETVTQAGNESVTQPVTKSVTQPVTETVTPRRTEDKPKNTKGIFEDNNQLPNASSPGRESNFGLADDDQFSNEEKYAAARDILQTLEDNGAGLLAAVEDSNPDLSLTQRVIEAANLA